MSSPKRILVVSQHYWPENFRLNDITDYFIEQGYDVDVLCGLPNYPKGDFFEHYGYFGKRHEIHNGVRVDRVLEIKRGNNSNIRIFLNYVSFPFFSLFHLPKLLVRQYDHVFLYQLSPVMMSLVGILVGKIKRIPTTMYVLDLWPENLFSVLPISNRILRTLVTSHSHWYYRHTDKVVALSGTMQAKLADITGKGLNEIAVIPQACEKIYERTVNNPELTERFADSFNIVFTGNISPAQSFQTMITAAKILAQDGYLNVKWVIVGDGMSRKDIEQDITKAGLSDIFVFEGQKPIQAIPEYIHIADILVGCLVRSELLEATVPAKVMSYIASGKPIVLAMDGEVQKLITDEIKCGYVGPTEDAHVLAANIKRVYDMSSSERLTLGSNARRYHFKHFERNLVLEKLVHYMLD